MLSKSEYVQGTRVPSGLLEPLGLLLVHFSLLEESLDDTLSLFLDLDKARGRLVAAQINDFKIKLEMLNYLADSSLPKESDRQHFSRVIKLCTVANNAKHHIIHGDWHYSGLFASDNWRLERSAGPEGEVTDPINRDRILNAARHAYRAHCALVFVPNILNLAAGETRLSRL